MNPSTSPVAEELVRLTAGPIILEGMLTIPREAEALIAFAHGSGSSRHSPRNRFVARAFGEAGMATLLIDLLTTEEEQLDAYSSRLRFDIELLADRLVGATDWLMRDPRTRGLRLGYFGASTGAGAALVAAARRAEQVSAVVSRGGRPDLAGPSLHRVVAPTLLIVGGADMPVIALNHQALDELAAPEKQLVIVPGATHLFEEPGALDEVARLATDWFLHHLSPEVRAHP